MSRFLVKVVFLVALLCLFVGTAAGQEFCDDKGKCELSKKDLDARLNRAYQLGYERGYNSGYATGAAHARQTELEYKRFRRFDLQSIDPATEPSRLLPPVRQPELQFTDPGTGPPRLSPPGGIPGN